ncbi:15576_t:CDS:2, partial [Racocetra fulgida]
QTEKRKKKNPNKRDKVNKVDTVTEERKVNEEDKVNKVGIVTEEHEVNK